jgi:hypothetical protein
MAVDPNMAEGMPVRKTPFVVRSGRLEPLLDSAPLVNGSLAEWKRGSPAGWTADKPGLVSFRDDQVTCQGQPTLRQDHSAAKGGPVRLCQPIQVQPWHYYHVSVMAKTKGCTSQDFRIFALGAGMAAGANTTVSPGGHAGSYPLNWQPPPIKPTMNWTRLDATFSSLDNTQVTLYLGSWASKGGTIWWSDVRLEPGGLVNVIRRPSLPLTITSDDGQSAVGWTSVRPEQTEVRSTAYVEGRDFSEVQDPKLGYDPNPGYFNYWHQPPAVTIPAGSRLQEGQRVLADYHFATLVGKSHQITCCLSEPKVYELIEAQIRWVKEVIRPDVYFMSHDEIRHCGWDDSCARRHLTCGQILADNVRKCVEIIQRTDPGRPIAAWNDMFDPFHNARKQGPMYLAKGDGPWAGSWEGLPAGVTIANWNQNNADSLQFFAGRGHGQILAGYYDADPRRIVAWLKLAAQVQGVRGVIYTTWVGDYSKLEVFMENVRQFEQK